MENEAKTSPAIIIIFGACYQFMEANLPNNFPNYKAGSQGAEDAKILIAKDGHSWFDMPINDLS